MADKGCVHVKVGKNLMSVDYKNIPSNKCKPTQVLQFKDCGGIYLLVHEVTAVTTCDLFQRPNQPQTEKLLYKTKRRYSWDSSINHGTENF